MYEKILALKNAGIDMVVVTAIEKHGEGPVEVGKKMLVSANGELMGTVGGGALEYYAVDKARELIKTRKHLKERYVLNDEEVIPNAKTLPMVCGGVVTLFYEFIGAKNHIIVFGAGHVAQALAPVLKTLQYHITVIDDRKPVIDAFKGADEKVHKPFVSYIDDAGIKAGSIVVVCTPSHKHDYNVIHAIIKKQLKPKYIGMLCSEKKLVDYLEKTYEAFGKNVDLSNFYSPIGLDTGGSSPEAIAISIASEILAVEHGKKGHRHLRETLHENDHYW